MGSINLRNSRLFLRILPVLVWLSAVAGVVGLFHRRAGQFEIVGIANAESHDVGTNTRARLISVNVQLFKKVSEGDPVAIVNTAPDDERLEAEKAVIEAEIKATEAQLKELRDNYEAEIFNRQSEWWAEMRAFTADVVMADKNILDANIVLEDDRAELDTIKMRIKNFKIENATDLAGGDISLTYQLQTMEDKLQKLEKKIKRDKAVLATYEEEKKKALARKAEYVKYLPQAGADSNESRRVIELVKESLERQIDELNERLRGMVLTAPCDGFVSSIDSQIGEVVILPDFPILTITEEKPSSIIAYVNENLVGNFTVNQEVEIVKRSEPKQIGRSEITYIAPRVETLPTRVWTDLNIPRYGRLIKIEIPLGMKLIPNEMVGIRIL